MVPSYSAMLKLHAAVASYALAGQLTCRGFPEKRSVTEFCALICGRCQLLLQLLQQVRFACLTFSFRPNATPPLQLLCLLGVLPGLLPCRHYFAGLGARSKSEGEKSE